MPKAQYEHVSMLHGGTELCKSWVELQQGQSWPSHGINYSSDIIRGIMESPRLEAMIGKEVLALTPLLNAEELKKVTILGVETGGLWMKSEAFSQAVLRGTDLAAALTPILFVPFSQLTCLVIGGEMVLSEQAFGVASPGS